MHTVASKGKPLAWSGHQMVRRRAFSTSAVPSGKKKQIVTGRTPGGKEVRFGVSRVKSITLKDFGNKTTVGVSFPMKSTDYELLPRWSASAKRSSDVQYSKNHGGTTKGLQEEVVAAPWSGTPIFYAHAHADPMQFAVTVKGTKKKPEEQVVALDGTTYAKILAGNKFVRKIMSETPYTALVMLSCLPGHPDGDAAVKAVAELRKQGYVGDVYAPSGKGFRLYPSDEESGYGVAPNTTATGKPVPGVFVKFPGVLPAVPKEEE